MQKKITMKTSALFVALVVSVFSFQACGSSEKNEKKEKEESKKETSVTEEQETENAEPWNENQLIEPADLAAIIQDKNAAQPVVFSIGPGGELKGSVDIGPAEDPANLDKLKSELEKLDKNTEVVIFCGCCPFRNCPNIRPAFALLNEMQFTNPKLLNLSQNFKTDWIDKGYPMNE